MSGQGGRGHADVDLLETRQGVQIEGHKEKQRGVRERAWESSTNGKGPSIHEVLDSEISWRIMNSE